MTIREQALSIINESCEKETIVISFKKKFMDKKFKINVLFENKNDSKLKNDLNIFIPKFFGQDLYDTINRIREILSMDQNISVKLKKCHNWYDIIYPEKIYVYYKDDEESNRRITLCGSSKLDKKGFYIAYKNGSQFIGFGYGVPEEISKKF